MFLHVVSGSVGHVLVKSSEQNGPHHYSDIETKSSQETPALQSHIGRPDHQGLSRAVAQVEQVITEEESQGVVLV